MAAPADSNSGVGMCRSIRPRPVVDRYLPQDLAIEVLSFLDLRDSNYLAHVSHAWLHASRIERRRIVKLTEEMVENLGGKHFHTRPILMPILNSPLARLITHVPDCYPFQFVAPEAIVTARTNFPNLLHIVIELSHPLPVEMKLFHLPPQLNSIEITSGTYLTCEQQQLYLDRLSTATQLHTIKLSGLDPDLNLVGLTQLPQLTDLIIYRWPTTPIPDHVLSTLSSLEQLVSLSIGWTILSHQWCQLSRLPHLHHISHDNDRGVCSTDLVPLTDTAMVKSIRRLRLRLAADADLSQLRLLAQFTQLHELDLFRWFSAGGPPPLDETDIRQIQAALIQLKTLTSLTLYGICLEQQVHKINLCDVFTASPHLTALELKDGWSSIDCDFFRAPVVHQRLVDFNLIGYFRGSDLAGLLQCVHLRRLQIAARIGRVEDHTSPTWWNQLKMKLDSRQVLPALEHLLLVVNGKSGTAVVYYPLNLSWDLSTGSKTHPNFRLANSNVTVVDAGASAVAIIPKAAGLRVAKRSAAPPASKLPVNISVIGTDGLSSIAQLLEWNELIPLSQVNHLFYDALKRRASYYHRPYPSFQRSEFNIVAYKAWVDLRRPLMLTPNQLFIYSRSLVMSHQPDIILQIGRCQTYAKSPFHNSTSSPQQQLAEVRAAVKRFTNVRSFKILFHPHPDSFGAQCHHQFDVPRPTWQLLLIQVCLEEWGAGLISFELEIHPQFRCTLPKGLITSHLYHLTSLQHVGFYQPAFFNFSHFYDPHALAAHLRFASDEIGVLVFSGTAMQQERIVDGVKVRQLIVPKTYTNASHCIWLDHASRHVFEYFDQTNQLLTEPPLTFLPHQPYLVEPALPFTRSQLCNLDIDSTDLNSHPPLGEYRFGIMKEQLQMVVDNFIRCPSSHGLQSLTIHDFFPRPQVDLDGVRTNSIDYRRYLHHLRPHLRRFTFASNCIIPLSQSNVPLLPFYGLDGEDDDDEEIWPQLEALTLSFPSWKNIDDGQYPPLDQETWVKLGRKLPKLHTLSISGGLLPRDQPYVGLLNNIRHLACHLRAPSCSVHQAYSVDYSIRTIILQMPQLESLELCIRPAQSWQLGLFRSYLWANLLPLLLSTHHLQVVKCDYITYRGNSTSTMDTVTEEYIDPDHEANVLYCYAIWKYLQPSLVIPLDYTNFYALTSPLFFPTESTAVHRRLACQNLTDKEDTNDYSNTRYHLTWSKRIDRKLNEWKSQWHKWRDNQQWLQRHRQLEREKRIAPRIIKLKHIQADLDLRLKQLLESIGHPDHTIAPRPFTLQLVPGYPQMAPINFGDNML